MHEFRDADPVGSGHWLDAEVTACKVAEKPDLGVGAEPRADEVDDLGDHERRDDERFWVVE